MSDAMPSVRRSAAPAVAGIGVASASTGASIETDSTSSRSAMASRLSARRSAVSAEIDSWSYLMSDCVRRSSSLTDVACSLHAAGRSRACDDHLCPPHPRARSRACARRVASQPTDVPKRSRGRSPPAPTHEQTSIPKPTCPLVRQPGSQRHGGWHTPKAMRGSAHNVAPVLATGATDW